VPTKKSHFSSATFTGIEPIDWHASTMNIASGYDSSASARGAVGWMIDEEELMWQRVITGVDDEGSASRESCSDFMFITPSSHGNTVRVMPNRSFNDSSWTALPAYSFSQQYITVLPFNGSDVNASEYACWHDEVMLTLASSAFSSFWSPRRGSRLGSELALDAALYPPSSCSSAKWDVMQDTVFGEDSDDPAVFKFSGARDIGGEIGL
jgi:hypothetical protein